MSSRGSAAGDTPGEREIIEHIRGRLPEPPPSLVVAIGDDAAVAVPERGALQVLTTDALVEGVHFERRFSSLADVGYKAIAVNASDVAAMGGTPSMALLSLMLPAGTSMAEIDALLDGVLEMAAAARVTVAGGNITRSPGPLIVDVTVTGHVRPRRVLTRSGGRPGDALYVTGTIGAAAAGLEWLREHPESGDFRLKAEATENRPEATENRAGVTENRAGAPDPRGFRLQAEGLMLECVQRHRRPEPRLRVGALLGRTRTASACMDLSDGLAGAVTQIAEASGTGAVIEASALPVHPGALAWFTEREQDPIVAALAGGDDYELLFAVKPKASGGRLRALAHAARGVSLTRIGELTEDPAVVLVRDGRPEPLPRGFLHF